MKIAFFGASGTGKTTLAKAVAQILGLTFNPVGSRSVAQSMGFEKPYDVDAAGRRVDFQIELSKAKLQWESARHSFVTDRTGADEWAYANLHAPTLITSSVGNEYGNRLVRITSQYDLIFHTPIDVFQNLAGDPARQTDPEYHERTEDYMTHFMDRFGFSYRTLDTPHLQERIDIVVALAEAFELENLNAEEIWHD